MLPESFLNFARLREPSFSHTSQGLPLGLVRDERAAASTIMALVRSGVRYESQQDWGASHFLEHILMRGTEEYPTLYELSRRLEGLGGQTSAYSTRDLTAFWVKVPATFEAVGLEVLGQLLFKPSLRQEYIDAERQLIEHERKRELANCAVYTANCLESFLLAPNPMSRHPVGTDEGLDKMTPEYLRNFLHNGYNRNNICLAAYGCLSDDSPALIDKLASLAPQGPAAKPANFLVEENAFRDGSVVHRTSPHRDQVFLAMGWRFPILTHRDLVAWRVVNTLLGAGYTSLFNQELRENHSLTYLCTTAMNAYDGMGVFKLHLAMRDKDLLRAMDMVESIITRLAEGKIPEHLFQEAAMRHAAGIVYRCENALEYVRLLGHSMARDGEHFSLYKYLNELEQVEMAQAASLASKYLSAQQRLTFVYSGSEELAKIFPNMVEMV